MFTKLGDRYVLCTVCHTCIKSERVKLHVAGRAHRLTLAEQCKISDEIIAEVLAEERFNNL